MSFDFYMDAEEEWCYDTNPICDFPNLKKRLTDMGIQIGQANAWRSVGTVDVLLKTLVSAFSLKKAASSILMTMV